MNNLSITLKQLQTDKFILTERRIGRFLIGASDAVTDTLCQRLIPLFNSSINVKRGGVVGAQRITREYVEGLGKVVVKHYVRGGILKYALRRSYLKTSDYRSKHEYLLLHLVRKLGISAPEPIAYGIEGKLFYRTWLVLAELEGVIALADLTDANNQPRFELAMEQLVIQVEKLIENRIFHVDLHPGNVVIDHTNQLYILDFDKAQIFEGQLNDLRDMYLRRWRRAVIKHGLPESFSELFCARLRKRFSNNPICQTENS
jgi:3-deoxy-D-manno-octulosonic acid kinase